MLHALSHDENRTQNRTRERLNLLEWTEQVKGRYCLSHVAAPDYPGTCTWLLFTGPKSWHGSCCGYFVLSNENI